MFIDSRDYETLRSKGAKHKVDGFISVHCAPLERKTVVGGEVL